LLLLGLATTRSKLHDKEALPFPTSSAICRATNLASRKTSELLFGFLVLLVLAAVTAVLADGKTVRVILLVFHSRVIATFAIAASQRDYDAVVLLSQVLSSSRACGCIPQAPSFVSKV
jgi:hypothetical protein